MCGAASAAAQRLGAHPAGITLLKNFIEIRNLWRRPRGRGGGVFGARGCKCDGAPFHSYAQLRLAGLPGGHLQQTIMIFATFCWSGSVAVGL